MNHTPSDLELVQNALSDLDAFGAIVDRYEYQLKVYILRISNVSDLEAEEILQEVFIKAWKNLNGFDHDMKLSSWLYRITHNEVISNYRKLKSRGEDQRIETEEDIFETIADLHQQVKDARPGSTRVRAALANLAVQRWQDEAPIWGHGVVETGPKMVEFMPIGSHHSWYGLLFVKGIVGLFALAIPMVFTCLYLALVCGDKRPVWISILIMTIFVCYSFFENLEILAYLLWPALLWLGATLNPLKEGGLTQ